MKLKNILIALAMAVLANLIAMYIYKRLVKKT